jgi:hypothetical protein
VSRLPIHWDWHCHGSYKFEAMGDGNITGKEVTLVSRLAQSRNGGQQTPNHPGMKSR